MASFRSSNDCISVRFDNSHPKLSTDTYFEVRIYSMLSKQEHSRSVLL